MQTILIGGAMDIEIEYLLSQLQNCTSEITNSFTFYCGEYCGHKIIISKTEMGIISSAIATCIGINKYKPDCVINQGTAGAHTENLHKHDIIIGKYCANINALEMPTRQKGEGIEPNDWIFLSRSAPICGDTELVNIFDAAKYDGGNKICGIIGSGDIFSKECDRIAWLHEHCGELCEDMESASVYETCRAMSVPCVAVRVISNNELTGESFDETTAIGLQKFILATIKTAM